MIARTLTVTGALLATFAGFASGQTQAPPFRSLEELHASYARQDLELDQKRIGDLATLAATLKGDEAEAAYRELFGLAVGRNLYGDAEAAGRAYLKSGSATPQELALAALVVVIAQADRGEYEKSLAMLHEFFQQNPLEKNPAKRLDPGTVIAVGEAYLQRLLRGGRYEIAAQAAQMVIDRRPEPEIRDHFTSRLNRLKRIGKTAPEIEGKDVEGKTIRLSDMKGKVVLVDFWATWCPPCLEAFPELKALHAKYQKDGFEILGVNLDAHRDDVDGLEKATPVVRQFLLNYRASWPSVLVGEPQKGDPADAYGVDEIPAGFLIDREGKIIHLEMSGADLSAAIEKALKK